MSSVSPAKSMSSNVEAGGEGRADNVTQCAANTALRLSRGTASEARAAGVLAGMYYYNTLARRLQSR